MSYSYKGYAKIVLDDKSYGLDYNYVPTDNGTEGYIQFYKDYIWIFDKLRKLLYSGVAVKENMSKSSLTRVEKNHPKYKQHGLIKVYALGNGMGGGRFCIYGDGSYELVIYGSGRPIIFGEMCNISKVNFCVFQPTQKDIDSLDYFYKYLTK